MPTIYLVSLKAPISSWHRPYTIVIACKHIHFIAIFGVNKKRWYKSLKNSYLKVISIGSYTSYQSYVNIYEWSRVNE